MVDPVTGAGSGCDVADSCVHAADCPFRANCVQVDGGERTEPIGDLAATVNETLARYRQAMLGIGEAFARMAREIAEAVDPPAGQKPTREGVSEERP